MAASRFTRTTGDSELGDSSLELVTKRGPEEANETSPSVSSSTSSVRRYTKHGSILGEKRGFENNIQLGDLFSAIEDRSLAQLKKYLYKKPSLINTHGGPFCITPLHFATEVGWVEGVDELLSHGGSVCSRNQFTQTPLHYAAKVKQECIMSLLLASEGSMKAINFQDIRGMLPLHVAASTGYLPVVKLLLESGVLVNTIDKQGESPLHKAAKVGAYDVMVALMEAGADLREQDLRGMCAMQWLILSTNNGLQKLMDHLLISNDSVNQRSPITFNFLPLVTRIGTQQCQLLSYFIETGNRHILAHPVCHVFILIKWRTMKYVFYGYLLYFILYATLTCIFIFLPWIETTPQNTSDVSNTSYPEADSNSPRGMYTMQVLLGIMALTIIMNQLYRLRLQGRTCIKTYTFWFQLMSGLCVSVLLIRYWLRGKDDPVSILETNISVAELLFLQLQFLFIFREFPSYGLYVAMFIKVAREFLKLFVIYCTILVSFTSIMFLLFNDNRSKTDVVNSNWPMLFLKSVTMMVGSVEIDDSLAKDLTNHPYTGYVLFFFSVVFISIVLANLLVALAVSDIRELRASAHLTRLASMVESILNMERSCTFPLLHSLANYCKLDAAATHVRLWPQEDCRHPTIMVEVREQPHLMSQRSRCWFKIMERFHPHRYQVRIPVTLRDEVMARVTAKNSHAINHDQLNVPHDYKVFFDEVLRTLKLLEVSHLH